jgi:hypothetical protein
MVSNELTLELLSWRQRIEQDFVFKPEHGVDMNPREGGGKVAVARFKTVQARRILIAARQLESLAQVGYDELNRDLRDFDAMSTRAQELAKELRNVQSARRRWEREVNRSPTVIAAATAAPPLVGLVLYWLFG